MNQKVGWTRPYTIPANREVVLLRNQIASGAWNGGLYLIGLSAQRPFARIKHHTFKF